MKDADDYFIIRWKIDKLGDVATWVVRILSITSPSHVKGFI